MSDLVESSSSPEARKPARLWPIAFLILAIVFVPALAAWAFSMLGH